MDRKAPSLAKEGRGGSKKTALQDGYIPCPFGKGKAWEWVKDPPAGEGQVGQNTGIIPLFTPHYIGIIPIFTPKNERKSPENLRNSLKISIFASDKAKDLC